MARAPCKAANRRVEAPPRAFAAWSWLMLLVVLLSAVPSGGPARTRLVGSAFDPTTVAVALSPKQPKAKATAQAPDRRRLPDLGPGHPPAQMVAAVAMTAVLSGPLRAALRPSARGMPPAAPRALVRARGPRAPPEA